MLRARAAIRRAPPCAAAAARCGCATLRGIVAAPRRPIVALKASRGADDAKQAPEPNFDPNLEPLADVAKAVSDAAADVSEALSETGVPASAKPKPKPKAAKKAEAAAAAEASKAEAKNAEAPKADAKKVEPPTADANKVDAAKADAKKGGGAPTPQPPQPEAPKPAAAASKAAQPPPKKEPQPARQPAFEFACPICNTTTFKMDGMPAKSGNLVCPRCSRKFAATEQYIDLTLTSGLQAKVYNQRGWAGQELFRSPLISFVYERGWRQGFSRYGFPGADTEFRYALDFLQPAYGETLLDMSCGSGLFSRRFAKSGRFSGVIAADFSETMLQQARSYFKEDGSLGGATPITLLRADVGRLPFATGSLAAVHAGAALHCWPNPQAALAEISRVLRPGGVFVASTFLVASAPLGQLLNNDELVRPFNQLDPMGGVAQQQYKWWEEQELKDLCNSVGLDRYTRERSNRFIMLCARKPGTSPAAAA